MPVSSSLPFNTIAETNAPPPSEAMIKPLVERIVKAQFQHYPPQPARPIEAWTDAELLQWSPHPSGQDPDIALTWQTPPSFRQRKPLISKKNLDFQAIQQHNPPPIPHFSGQPTQYQFRPFSFQEEADRLQSVTTTSGMPQTDHITGYNQRAYPAAMMTAARQVSYNASQYVTFNTGLPSKGGTMVDLSGYKDLTEPPVSNGGEQTATLTRDSLKMETEYSNMNSSSLTPYSNQNVTPHPEVDEDDIEIYGEYSGNVKTLVKLVNDLPEGVTKQTGAQIIRLTMEAMGISMETVLSDAQTVQSQLLDAVRSNIKKIEEYKTVIRKLETEIRFHQGKANELSEIIDLFILSNTTPNMPNLD